MCDEMWVDLMCVDLSRIDNYLVSTSLWLETVI